MNAVWGDKIPMPGLRCALMCFASVSVLFFEMKSSINASRRIDTCRSPRVVSGAFRTFWPAAPVPRLKQTTPLHDWKREVSLAQTQMHERTEAMGCLPARTIPDAKPKAAMRNALLSFGLISLTSTRLTSLPLQRPDITKLHVVILRP